MVMEPLLEHYKMSNINSNLGSSPYGVYTDRPLMNQPTIFARQPLEVLTRPVEFLRYMMWFKKTPECVSLVSAMVTDVLSDGYEFEGSKSGRDRAEEFMVDNNGDAQLEGGLFDNFILGNGFWYKGEVTAKKAKELRNLFIKSRGFRNKEYVSSLLAKFDRDSTNDEAVGNKSFQYIPATTMNITPADKFASSLIYTQRVGPYVSAFPQDEIIHLRDMNLNGELWGTPRFKSIISEVTLLGILKDYYGHELDNYGVPPGMFAMPDEQPDSPNVKNIDRLLIEGQKPENKNRVWVMAGNVQYTSFDRLKDMEFKNLADFLTHVIAMVWQVPPSRWGGSMTKENGKDQALSNQGYYRNISHLQTKLENILNSQLFVPEFNVKIKFKRTHREDEVRVAQADKIKTDLVEQRLNLGLWSKETALKYLEIQEEDAGEFDPTENLGNVLEGANQYNQVGADNSTLRHSAEVEVSKKKAPKNRSASSDVRAEGNE